MLKRISYDRQFKFKTSILDRWENWAGVSLFYFKSWKSSEQDENNDGPSPSTLFYEKRPTREFQKLEKSA